MKEHELIPKLFKTEYSKIIAVLCKSFGIIHIEVAEDIVNDTFLLASETWGLKGIPDNPSAWLYSVAKNRTIDFLRRNKNFIQNIATEIRATNEVVEEFDIDLSDENIKDSELQMIFAVCNPVISSEAQIGLALRVLCGFGIDEIAEAFLTTKETINKRLFRAKNTLRSKNISIAMPKESELDDRLESVLLTIYLLFNEGYYSSTKNQILRKDLCFEAMRLCYVLSQNKQTNLPIVNALMALMCFHSSRFDSRINESGGYVLYENQKRETWDADLIEKGNYYLRLSAKGKYLSKFHIEAGIASLHAVKSESENKWLQILQLYNRLLQIEYSPIVALNRTYALAKVKGEKTAIKEALKINLKDHPLYYSLLAELYKGIDKEKEVESLNKALELVKTDVEAKNLKARLKKALS